MFIHQTTIQLLNNMTVMIAAKADVAVIPTTFLEIDFSSFEITLRCFNLLTRKFNIQRLDCCLETEKDL